MDDNNVEITLATIIRNQDELRETLKLIEFEMRRIWESLTLLHSGGRPPYNPVFTRDPRQVVLKQLRKQYGEDLQVLPKDAAIIVPKVD
jgi:hypothetical protein